jgi:hypothetical protein
MRSSRILARSGVRLSQQQHAADNYHGTSCYPVNAKRGGSAAAKHQVPAVYFLREFAESGGLASYGIRLADAYWQAGAYVGKILGGTRRSADQIRTSHQSQDRQNTRPCSTSEPARHRRRGDRIAFALLRCVSLLLTQSGHPV